MADRDNNTDNRAEYFQAAEKLMVDILRQRGINEDDGGWQGYINNFRGKIGETLFCLESLANGETVKWNPIQNKNGNGLEKVDFFVVQGATVQFAQIKTMEQEIIGGDETPDDVVAKNDLKKFSVKNHAARFVKYGINGQKYDDEYYNPKKPIAVSVRGLLKNHLN